MNIQIPRNALLSAIQTVIGAAEKRQTLPILSTILLTAKEDQLHLAATDLEMQLECSTAIQNITPGSVAAPARKLHDICKGLPEGAAISIEHKDNRLVVKSGRSRFTLATLASAEFPSLKDTIGGTDLKITGGELTDLINRTQFAMATNDVRYFLNGILMEIEQSHVRIVATDGHRLALSEMVRDTGVKRPVKAIVPRKAVQEMLRMVDDQGAELTLTLSENHLRLQADDRRLVTKLIEGRFPDYQRVIPDGGLNVLRADRNLVRAALSRAAILSNEKFRGVRLCLDASGIRVQSTNPSQEEANEEVEASYEGQNLEIGFNVGYMLDALDALEGNEFVLKLSGVDASGLIFDPGNVASKYVVMPLRL